MNDENNLLITPESQPTNIVPKQTPLVSNDSLLKISPAKLTSPYASESEKIKFAQADQEFGKGLLGAPDYVDDKGNIAPVGAPNPADSETPLTDVYAFNNLRDKPFGKFSDSAADAVEVEQMLSSGGMSTDEIKYWAEKNAPERARQQKIMGEFARYKDGQMSYEDFLIKAYGNDYLKAQGYNTESVAWWKSQFREGSFQHPLDNEFTRKAALQQAEGLFQLESFYAYLSNPETRSFSGLVGKRLEEQDYVELFGDSWEQVTKQLGNYEKALRYFKGGYLGDSVNQLIYRTYNTDGTPVGDPSWYVATDGKLYELVSDRSKNIDKSTQMYLVKNNDGTIDRVTMLRTEFEEGANAFFGGFLGGLTGIVDLGAIAGLGIASLFQGDKGNEFFTDKFAEYNTTMNTFKSLGQIVQDYDNDQWDASSLTRSVGGGVGYVFETAAEIFLSIITSGGYGAAVVAAKAAREAGEATMSGAAKGFIKQVANNAARLGIKKATKTTATKVAGEAVEAAATKVVGESAEAAATKVVTESAEAIAEKALKSFAGDKTVEEALESVATAVLKELPDNIKNDAVKKLVTISGKEMVENASKESVEGVAKTFVKEIIQTMAAEGRLTADMTEASVTKAIISTVSKEIQDEVVIKTTSRGIRRTILSGAKRTTKQVLSLSNSMKMLNSGSVPFLMPLFKWAGKKWAPTVSRAFVSSALTAMEVAAHQRVRQVVDPTLTDEQIGHNTALAALVQFASTILLSTGTNDKDNIARFARDTDPDKALLMQYRAMLGKSNYTFETVQELATQQGRAITQEVFNKFNEQAIGKAIIGKNVGRFVGGVSELLDNILTSSSRTAAMSGVKTPWGALFNVKGMFSPDVLVPAILSAQMSIVGRKGFFGTGLGANEGSMYEGAAAAVEDVKTIYMSTHRFYEVLSEYASDPEARTAARLIVKNMDTQFAAKMKDVYQGNVAFAMLDIIEDLANKASKGGVSRDNPFGGIDSSIKAFAKDEGFKNAVKAGMFAQDTGLKEMAKALKKLADNKNSDFSLASLVGLNLKEQQYKKFLSYEKSLISEMIIRREKYDEVINKSYGKYKDTALGVIRFVKRLANFDPMYRQKKKMDYDIQSGVSSNYMYKLFGEADIEARIKRLEDDNPEEIVNIFNAVGVEISLNEIKAQMRDQYKFINDAIKKNMKTYGKANEAVLQKESFLKLVDIVAKQYGFNESESCLIIANAYAKDKSEAFAPEQLAFVREQADIISKEVAESNKDFILSLEDVLAIQNNHTHNGKVDMDELKLCLENGYLVSFFPIDEVKSAMGKPSDDPDRLYLNLISAGIKALKYFNAEEGSDFIILPAKKADGTVDPNGIPRIFVNNPKPLVGLNEMGNTQMRLKQAIIFGGILSTMDNPESSQENLVYAKALYSALHYNKQSFNDIDDLIYFATINKDSPSQFAAFLDDLENKKIISARQVLNLIKAMSSNADDDNDFNIAVIKQLSTANNNQDSLSKKIFTTSDYINDIVAIRRRAGEKGEITPKDNEKLIQAAAYLHTKVFTKDEKGEVLADLFNINDNDFRKEIQFIYENHKINANFQVGLEELDTLYSKAFSVNSTLKSDLAKINGERKRIRELIKRLRTIQLEELSETNEQFEDRLKGIEEKRNTIINSVEQVINKIQEMLSDPSVLETLRQNPKELNELIKQLTQEYKPSLKTKKKFNKAEAAIENISNKEFWRGVLNDFETDLVNKKDEQGLQLLAELRAKFDADTKDVSTFNLFTKLKELSGGEQTDELIKIINDLSTFSNKKVKDYFAKTIFDFDSIDSLKTDEDLLNYVVHKTLGNDYYSSLIGSKEKYYKKILEDTKKLGTKVLSDFILSAYEDGFIYTSAEKLLADDIEIKNRLYNDKNTQSAMPNKGYITVDLGQVYPRALAQYERDITKLYYSKNGQLDFEAVSELIKGRPDAAVALKQLNAIRSRNKNSPIISYDLSIPSDAEEFGRLLNFLGYGDDNFLAESSAGTVFDLEGIYYNGDSRAVVAKKSEYTYKNVKEMRQAEQSALKTVFLTQTLSGSIAERELLMSMFPGAGLLFDENTPVKKGKQFEVSLEFSEADAKKFTIYKAAKEITAMGKSGKVAGKQGDNFSIILRYMGYDTKVSEEMSNYFVLRNIIEGVKELNDANDNHALYLLPKNITAEKKEALKEFGFELNKDEDRIIGIRVETTAKFLKENKGSIDIVKYLPVEFDDKEKRFKLFSVVDDIVGIEKTFSRNFDEEIRYFNTLIKDGNTIIKLPKGIDEDEIKIDYEEIRAGNKNKVITYGDVLAYLKNKKEYENNLTAKSLIMSIESMIAAAKEFDTFLTPYFADKEQRKRIMQIGQVVQDKDLAEVVAKATEDVNGVDTILNAIKAKIKTKAPLDSILGEDKADVKASVGISPVAKSYTIFDEYDYGRLYDELNGNLTVKDIHLLKSYANSSFVDDAPIEALRYENNIKNKFLSLLAQGEDGSIILPVANLRYITSDDLELYVEDYYGQKLKLGTWIKENLGETFYNNMVETIGNYLPITKRAKLMQSSIRKSEMNILNSPSATNYSAIGNKAANKMRDLAESRIQNAEEMARRRDSMDDTKRATSFASDDKVLDPIYESITSIADSPLSNHGWKGNTRVANVKNIPAIANTFENIINVENMLKSGTMKVNVSSTTETTLKISDDKEASDAAKKIFHLSTINTNEQKISFLIFDQEKIDDVGNTKVKTIEILADKEDPLKGLLNFMTQNPEKDGHEYFVLQIKPGFNLTNPDDENKVFQLINIRGFKDQSATEMAEKNFGRKLYIRLLAEHMLTEDYRNTLNSDEIDYAEKILTELNFSNRIADDKVRAIDIIVESIEPSFYSDDFTKENARALTAALLKNSTPESLSMLENPKYQEEGVEQTIDGDSGIIGFNKKRSYKSLRQQAILFDGIDIANEPRELKETFSLIRENILAKFKENKTANEKSDALVNKLLQGETMSLPKLMSIAEKQVDDQEVIRQTIVKYALRSENSSFKKFILQSMVEDNQSLKNVVKERERDTAIIPISLKLKGDQSVNMNVKDIYDNDEIAKVIIDSEFILRDPTSDSEERKPGRVYDIAITINRKNKNTGVIEKFKKSFGIRFDDDDYNIYKGVFNDSDLSYASARKFLNDNDLMKVFKAYGGDGTKTSFRNKSDTFASINNFLKENLSEQSFVLYTYNGKGKNSDVDSISDTFKDQLESNEGANSMLAAILNNKAGEAITDGATYIGHVDVFNDIIKVTIPDQMSSDDPKKDKLTLESVFNKMSGKNKIEEHTSSSDNELLEEALGLIVNSHTSRAKAQTKVIDYVKELYEALTKTEITEQQFDQFSDYFQKLIYGQSTEFENNEELKKRIIGWARMSRSIPEMLQNKIREASDYFDSRTQRVSQDREIESKVRYEVGYKTFDNIKNFLEENSDKETSQLIKHGFNKIYGIVASLTKLDNSDESYSKFMSVFMATLNSVYGENSDFVNSNNKNGKWFSDNGFFNLIKDLKTNENDTIFKLINAFVLENAVLENEITKSLKQKGDLKNYINNFELGLKDPNLWETLVDGDINKNSLTKDLYRNKVSNSSYAKFKNIFNFIDSILPDSDDKAVKEYIANSMLSFYGRSENDADTAYRMKQTADTMQIGNTDTLVDDLKELTRQGFKDALSISGHYLYARQITDEKINELKNAGLIGENETGSNILLVNKEMADRLLGGQSVEDFKESNGIRDGNIYVTVTRQPMDRSDPLHAYKLIVDNVTRKNEGPTCSMRLLNIVSKHNGDFDGDKINIYLPTKAMQRAYQSGKFLSYINKPYDDVENFLKAIRKETKFVSAKEDFAKNRDIQRAVDAILCIADSGLSEKFITLISNNASKEAYAEFESYIDTNFRKTLISYLSNPELEKRFPSLLSTTKGNNLTEYITTKKILNNIIKYDDVENKYLINNPYLANKYEFKDEIKKIIRNKLTQNAADQILNRVTFSQAKTMVDSLTGTLQQDMLKGAKGKANTQYVTMKLDDAQTDLIQAYITQVYNQKNNNAAEANKEIMTTLANAGFLDGKVDTIMGKMSSFANEELIKAGHIYALIVYNQHANRNAKEYKDLETQLAAGAFDAGGDKTEIEKQIDNITKANQMLDKITNKDSARGRFVTSRPVSLVETVELLDFANNNGHASRLKETAEFLTPDEMKAKGLTKQVTVLVDQDNLFGLDVAHAKATKRFADNNGISFYKIYENGEKPEKIPGARFNGKLKKIGDSYVQVFDADILQGKLGVINAGSFGKVTFNATTIDDKEFADYDFVISQETANKGFEKNSNVKIDNVKPVTIIKDNEEHHFYKVTYDVYAAENPIEWDQNVKGLGYDRIGIVHSLNTAEALPLFGGAIAKINKDRELVWDDRKINQITIAQERLKENTFRETNQASLYIQLKALALIKFGLEKIEDKETLKTINSYKDEFFSSNKDFSSANASAAVFDLFRLVNKKTNNGFTTLIQKGDDSILSRLFSKDLYNKSIINRQMVYNKVDIDDYEKKFLEDKSLWSSKRNANASVNELYEGGIIDASLEGPMMEGAAKHHSSSLIDYDLPSLQFINALLPENERVTSEDVQDLISFGFANIRKFKDTGLENQYKTVNALEESDATGGSIQIEDMGLKTGIEGKTPSISTNPMTNAGVVKDVGRIIPDVNYIYHTRKIVDENGQEDVYGNNAYKKLTETWFGLDNSKVRDGEKIFDKTQAGSFIYKLKALHANKNNLLDRIRMFAIKRPKNVDGYFNAPYTDLSDGVLTKKYYTNQGIHAQNIDEFKKERAKLIPGSFAYEFNKATKTVVDDMLASKTAITDKDISEAKIVKDELKSKFVLPKGIAEHTAMKTFNDVLAEESIIALKNASDFDGNYSCPEAVDLLHYFKQITSGYNSDYKYRYDPTDPEGFNTKTIAEMKVKNGVGVFQTQSKNYQMEMLSGLSTIQRILGNNQPALEEFFSFTKARGLKVLYEQAALSKDQLAIKRVEEQMDKYGYNDIYKVEAFIKGYSDYNPGLVKLYSLTVSNIIKAAKESSDILGIKNNPEELLLFTTLVPKEKYDPERKAKYFSTLNTVFLNKKEKLEDVLVRYADFNFVESVWYLSANLSKIKALKYAQKFYFESGATDNKEIFNMANDDFGFRLMNLHEDTKTKLMNNEKKQLIEALRKKDIQIPDKYSASPSFLSDVYGSIVDKINHFEIDAKFKKLSIYELEKLKLDELEFTAKDTLDSFIALKKVQRDFMTDCVLLNKDLANSIYGAVKSLAASKGAMLTNEFLQIVPESDDRHFNMLHGLDLQSVRRNVEYSMSGDTYAQRVAYMALTGNLFITNEGLAKHLDKYFYTDKIPSSVEKIFVKAKNAFAQTVMSMPHKLINRLTQYSVGDITLIMATSPSCVTRLPTSMNQVSTFFESGGATLNKLPDFKAFLDSIGMNPFSYQKGGLNLSTFEYDMNKIDIGKTYFDFVNNAFSAQTLAGRYALWLDLRDRFKSYEDNPNGKDKRLYGPLFSKREQIDSMESPEAKATEIVGASIGAPNKFALVARKELNNWGIFLTYPLALIRTGVGHLKSMGGSLKQIVEGTANNATLRYLGNTTLGLGSASLIVAGFASFIAELYGVDEETEKEWKERGTYIDPFLTLLNDRPIPIQMGTTGLYQQLREMFYEPFEEAEGDILKGGVNWFTANTISRLNPIVKTPLEVLTGKDFYGNAGPQDTRTRDFSEHLANKIMSMFIGAAGASAATDQWYYSKVGQEDPSFVNRLASSFSAAIEGEMGRFRGYKSTQKNYFKALTILRGYKVLQNGDYGFTDYPENGFDLKDMSGLSKDIKNAMDKEQPPSVVYGIIDEYIKDGASASTIKAAIFNNSISGKISQIKNFDEVYRVMSDKEKVVLDDALKYEDSNYSILKSLVQDYLDEKSGQYTYKKQLYLPKDYYTYPEYNSNKYKNYSSYQNSWFDTNEYRKYAKDYMEYRMKQNFVPSLTKLTGKYAKDFYDYGEPKRKRTTGRLDVERTYYSDDDDRNYAGYSKVNKKGR